jgi:hypothetical protein
MTIENIARLTIGMEPATRGAAVVVRCAGAWTVHRLAQLEWQLEALAWPEGELVRWFGNVGARYFGSVAAAPDDT